jgi:hypothetical protein
MPQTIPAANEVQDELAVDAFKQTIARFRDYDGEMQPSPLFGQLDRSAAERLQLAHCAHHLSHLMPNQ